MTNGQIYYSYSLLISVIDVINVLNKKMNGKEIIANTPTPLLTLSKHIN